jgi:hypothetical protein
MSGLSGAATASVRVLSRSRYCCQPVVVREGQETTSAQPASKRGLQLYLQGTSVRVPLSFDVVPDDVDDDLHLVGQCNGQLS